MEELPGRVEKLLAIEDALVKEIPVEMNHWVQMVNGEPRCFVCNKVATQGHLISSEHMKRMEEDAIGTFMAGKAQSTRRFNGDMCTGVPTKKKMYEFWGEALENLLSATKEKHLKKGAFYSGKKTITPAEARYELGIVSYPGTGKYNDANIYLPFHELPDVEDVANEEQLHITSPPGQGWWPVIALQTEVVSATMKKILIVCWY